MMVFNFRDIITMIRVINGGHDHNHSETYTKDNCKDQDNHDVEHNTSAKPTPYFECSKCFFELLRLTKTDPY